MDFPLDDLYAAMAGDCTFTPAGGAASQPIKAVLDARPNDALGGEQISTRYEVRVTKTAVGGAVARGALFVFGSVTYRATAHSQPMADGAELIVPVKVL